MSARILVARTSTGVDAAAPSLSFSAKHRFSVRCPYCHTSAACELPWTKVLEHWCYSEKTRQWLLLHFKLVLLRVGERCWLLLEAVSMPPARSFRFPGHWTSGPGRWLQLRPRD